MLMQQGSIGRYVETLLTIASTLTACSKDRIKYVAANAIFRTATFVMMAHISLLQAVPPPGPRCTVMYVIVCTVICYVPQQHTSSQSHCGFLQRNTLSIQEQIPVPESMQELVHLHA